MTAPHETATTVTTIAPWQAALYAVLATPPTLAEALPRVDGYGRCRALLQARGDAAAVAGVGTALRLALLKTAAVEARTARLLERKVRTLAAHRAVWADLPPAAAVIEAAVTADAAALGLGPDEQARLRGALRGAR